MSAGRKMVSQDKYQKEKESDRGQSNAALPAATLSVLLHGPKAMSLYKFVIGFLDRSSL